MYEYVPSQLTPATSEGPQSVTNKGAWLQDRSDISSPWQTTSSRKVTVFPGARLTRRESRGIEPEQRSEAFTTYQVVLRDLQQNTEG